MSDDNFMAESEEDYDFQYSEAEEDEENQELDLENDYYNAKSLKQTNPQSATQKFEEIVSSSSTVGEWGFKCLKQLIKLEFSIGYTGKVLEHFGQFLNYSNSDISAAYFERSLTNLLEFVACSQNSRQADCVEQVYRKTLALLVDANNERLWLRTQIKLANLWLSRREFAKLGKCISELKDNFILKVGDSIKELQMTSKIKNLYHQASTIRTAVPHPRILGIIRECGGKMHLIEGNWKAALADFFESFRSYDEAGSPNRLKVLKYLAISSILAGSKVDPFESQETKPYRSNPTVASFVALVEAFQHKDIEEYKRVAIAERELEPRDPYMDSYINEISRILIDDILGIAVSAYITTDLLLLAERHSLDYSEVQSSLGFLVTASKQSGLISQRRRKFLNNFSIRRREELLDNAFTAIERIQKIKGEALHHFEDDFSLTPSWSASG